MLLNDLIEYCKARAIEGVLLPDEEFIYRKICRAYSKTFHTELEKVFQMEPEKVVRAMLEERYDNLDERENLEELLDQIYTLEDPSYERQKQEGMEDFIKMAEEREQNRMKQTEKTPFSREIQKSETKPTGGSVDFGGLDEKKES